MSFKAEITLRCLKLKTFNQVESTYLTWQWADVGKKKHRKTTFFARDLPQASSAFLLFSYVSSSFGVLGSSDTFQIIHSCGHPLSVVSYPTTQSSFVVLEKATSSVRSISNKPRGTSSNDFTTNLDDNKDNGSRPQTSPGLKEANNIEHIEVNEVPDVENNQEVAKNTDGIFQATYEREDDNKLGESTSISISTAIAEKMGDGKNIPKGSKETIENAVTLTEGSILHLQLKHEMEKCHEMKMAIIRHNETLLKEISQLEEESGKRPFKKATSPFALEVASLASLQAEIDHL